MGERDILAPQPKSQPATSTVHAAGPSHGEMGHSGADLDLAQVTAEIARLEGLPTVEKAVGAFTNLQQRMAMNRKRREGPRSPDVQARFDTDYAAMQAQADNLERLVWGRTSAEASGQLAVNLGIAPGRKIELPEKPLIPTNADIAAKLEKLKAKRDQLLATKIERQQARRAAELKRAGKKPVSDEEKAEHIVREMGVQVKRPLTDFEAAIIDPPSTQPPNAPRWWPVLGELLPIIDKTTREPVAYVYSRSGYRETFDIQGNFLGSGEIPIEVSAVQLDDLILLKAPANILLKGAQGGVKYFASRAPRVGASLLRSGRRGLAATMIGAGDAIPAYSRALPPVAMVAETTQAAATQAPQQAAATIVRLESRNAWRLARPSSGTQAIIQEQARMGFIDPRLAQPGANVAAASAATSRSMTTAIRPQTAEMMGYDARLARAEVGIVAPAGSNIPGPDYITAIRRADGSFEIQVCDNKSRVGLNAFGRGKSSLPSTWQAALNNATAPGALDLGDPVTEQAIRDAVQQGRVRLVRDTMDFRPGVNDATRLRLDN